MPRAPPGSPTLGPKDVWWIQSEKEVVVLELSRNPAGLLVLGRDKNRLMAEEILVDPAVLRQTGAGRAFGRPPGKR